MNALGGTYTITTSLPLMQQFSVDLPVEQMARDASPSLSDAVRTEVQSLLPWIVAGAVGSAFIGALMANLIVPGGRAR